MMLGEPHRVVAGLVHDLEALDGAGIDGLKLDLAIRPAEELQHPDFHPPEPFCVPSS